MSALSSCKRADREGESGHVVRGVQRRPVVEQGAPLGCTAPGSDRALSKLPFGNNNVDSELFGDAYEYLIKKFADASNKKVCEFYTPRSAVRLMIDMHYLQETM